MSKRITELFLFDIYVSIEKILHHSSGFSSGEDLQYSYVDWDVVVREFEIIGEATNNLIKSGFFTDAKREVVNFRNILIHKYFGISSEEVWDIIVNYLPYFADEIKNMILNIEQSKLEELLAEIINENDHIEYIKSSLKNLKGQIQQCKDCQ